MKPSTLFFFSYVILLLLMDNYAQEDNNLDDRIKAMVNTLVETLVDDFERILSEQLNRDILR